MSEASTTFASTRKETTGCSHFSICPSAPPPTRFKIYERVLSSDRATQRLFSDILRDEEFHMNYTKRELVRVSPKKHGSALFFARAHRLWKGYLRIATAVAGVLGGLVLTRAILRGAAPVRSLGQARRAERA